MAATAFACPKRMTYGPCGGVDFDGSCEVSPHRCVFLDVDTVRWARAADAPASSIAIAVSEPAVPVAASAPAASPAPAAWPPPAPSPSERMGKRLEQGNVVVADLPARALDAASLAECAGILASRVDAVLAGDSGTSRVQFSPSHRALLLRAAGIDVWSGLNCRDRNRVALEGELAGLADIGAAGVHCVTGDHTRTGNRPDAMPVFDLDSTELTALARAAGHLVSVAESPAAPPVGRRPERLAEKSRAGAEVCFVNHAGGAEPVARFIRSVHDAGTDIAFLPCIPVVVDRGSAELLPTFTTLVLPEGYLDRILRATDPFAEGIAAAIELGRQMLEIDGVRGVNLSGGAAAGREAWFADALAMIGEELLP
jgi:5,10-methylenetetrahydrofolate reductase